MLQAAVEAAHPVQVALKKQLKPQQEVAEVEMLTASVTL